MEDNYNFSNAYERVEVVIVNLVIHKEMASDSLINNLEVLTEI